MIQKQLIIHHQFWRVYQHVSLPSTQEEAKSHLKSGYMASFVVTAQSQTQGQGQWERVWHSPKGHFYASVVLHDDLDKKSSPSSLLGAHAVMETIKRLANTHVQNIHEAITIKKPNDVLIHGKKVAGVLCEKDDAHHIIMGVGVNLAALDKNHPSHATTLVDHGLHCAPCDFLKPFLTQLSTLWYKHPTLTETPPPQIRATVSSSL